MGEKKVTKMIIRGDLQCYKCYKKIKKILCEIPQIQDQVYDEKNNKVTIVVVCCSPEKIRDLICSKACGCIESIEIVVEKRLNSTKEQPRKGCKEPLSLPQDEPPPPCQAIIPVVPAPPTPKPPPAPKPINLVPMPVLGCPPIFYPVMWYPCYVGCRGPCYHGRLHMCANGCGRSAHECMCPDGCGRPARKCMPARQFMCLDGCGRPACECMCLDGCGRLARDCMCPDGCGRSTRECMCSDGCGKPVNECHGSNQCC